jgi:capsular polysaccharide biosynthesis protein
MKFVIITHQYFMTHIAWKTEVVETTSIKEAEVQAGYINNNLSTQFKHADTAIIEIDNCEQISMAKLTWKQRITGRLK